MKVSLSKVPAKLAVIIGVAFFFFHLAGCAKKIPHNLNPSYEKKQIRLIAVLPVADKTNHPEVGSILRHEIAESLYFKQYPKIPLSLIDEKISVFYPGLKDPSQRAMPPRDVGGLLGVQAVMYITLEECSSRYGYVYAGSTIAARFQLFEVLTGEELWNTRYRASGWVFNLVPEWSKMDAVSLYGEAIEEIVKKVMDTLPDGPGL